MRRARQWAWVLRGPADLPPSDSILMGFEAGLPAKRLRIPKVSGRATAQGRGPVRGVAGSLGSSPPEGVIRGIPSACEPVLRWAWGSLQMLAPSDQGLRPLRRCDPLYVRSEPVPQFVDFLSMFFSFLPWLHRALSCSVLLLTRRLHMFVLRMSSPVRIFDSSQRRISFLMVRRILLRTSRMCCCTYPHHLYLSWARWIPSWLGAGSVQ